jgi:hypothetical protein
MKDKFQRTTQRSSTCGVVLAAAFIMAAALEVDGTDDPCTLNDGTAARVDGCGFICTGPTFRGIKAKDTDSWRIGNHTTVKCSECRAARWPGCGCRFVLATFPFTGNTWIRNFWDVATGVGAETGNYPEKGKYLEVNLGFGSSCGTNGGENQRAAYKKARSDAATLDLVARVAAKENATFADLPCDLIRRAGPSDPILYKTHHPLFFRDGEIEKFTSNNLVCGIILTNRSDTWGWCKTHGHERKYWAKGEHKEADSTWCPVGIAAEVEEFHKWYETDRRFQGVPVMTVDYSLMASNGSHAAKEFQRLLDFASVQVSKERFELAAHLHIRKSTGDDKKQDVDCNDWQCSCQGFSDKFHTTNMKHWGKAHGKTVLQHWWMQHGCKTVYTGPERE